jgi:tetrahydromethanopterin S-methyltransferase subunit B
VTEERAITDEQIARLQDLLSDIYAELDPVFQERLMRRVDAELHALHLSPGREGTKETKGDR